ncbi:MAG TPA: extracellular solute-binding protein [Streptosporangiaceae bacterium]|nr:extracellular solute-binding protein [Streptosporangiaceae bacterium]
MKSRLFAATVAAGAAALLAISACGSSGGNGGSSSGNVTLHFFGADYGAGTSTEGSTQFWDGVASAFHKKYPKVTVDVSTVNWNSYPDKVKTLIQNKQYPDILEGSAAPPYAQEGLIYPTSQILSQSVISNLVQKFLKDTDYQGQPYGVPWTTSTRAMCYNKSMFSQAGITSPPTTWAQLKSDAAAIKAKTGKIGFGLPLGPEEAQGESLLWFLGNGGGYVNTSGSYTINSAQNIATMTWLKSFAASGDTEPGAGTANRTDLWNEFAAGQIAMLNCSPAIMPIVAAKGMSTSNVGVATIPGMNGPLTSTLGVHDDIVAFKSGGHAAQIKEFLDFAYQDQWQMQFNKIYDLLPATASADQAFGQQNPLFTSYMTNIASSVNYPSNPNWTTVENQIKQTMGQAVTGNPASVLNTIQQTASTSS